MFTCLFSSIKLLRYSRFSFICIVVASKLCGPEYLSTFEVWKWGSYTYVGCKNIYIFNSKYCFTSTLTNLNHTPKHWKRKLTDFLALGYEVFIYKIIELTKKDCDKLVAIFLIIELVQLVFLSECIVFVF